jgi:hypothetical protein
MFLILQTGRRPPAAMSPMNNGLKRWPVGFIGFRTQSAGPITQPDIKHKAAHPMQVRANRD